MPGEQILIVEDDADIALLVRTNLEREGFHAHIAPTADAAWQMLRQFPIHLIVLDIMLPGMSGFDLLPLIRRSSDAPVIVLSARGDEPDKIIGLGLGADDYVAKPFQAGELVARVKAHLRRYRNMRPDADPNQAMHTAEDECCGLVIDSASRMVYVDTQPVELTKTEFDILALLSSQPGRVFTFDQIYRNVWREEPVGNHNVVMTHVKKVREKLHDSAKEPRFIKTVWGVGYRFVGWPHPSHRR